MISSPSFSGRSSSFQFPCVCDHQGEVLIIINVGRDVVVVLCEFSERDAVVVSTGVLEGRVDLEGVQELSQNFFTSLLSSSNVGMVGSIVNSSHIMLVHFT